MNKIIEDLRSLEYFSLEDIDNIMNDADFDYEYFKIEYGFITSEDADILIKSEINNYSIDRMSCFLAKIETINQDYYYINGYGNLENITPELLECFRSDLITELKNK